jgi:hypothetical protein
MMMKIHWSAVLKKTPPNKYIAATSPLKKMWKKQATG